MFHIEEKFHFQVFPSNHKVPERRKLVTVGQKFSRQDECFFTFGLHSVDNTKTLYFNTFITSWFISGNNMTWLGLENDIPYG